MGKIARTLVVAAVLWAGAAAVALSKEKVVIGELSFTGGLAAQHILKVVIEDDLDGEVSFIQGAEDALLAGMDKGDGSVDIFPDFWSQLLTAQYNAYIAPGSRETILLNDHPYQGTEGLFVPGYVQEKYGIKKIEQLADPQIAALFDTDGNGKGEWWPGEIGWNSTDHNVVRAKSYGFDKYFEVQTVNQVAMEALLDAAYMNQKPLLFYFWTPEWIHSAYDLRKLEEAPFTGYSTDDKKEDPRFSADGCFHFFQASEHEDWLERSKITCATPDTDVYVAYSKGLANRAPKIGRFLKQVYFTPEMMNELIRQISHDKKDPEDLARAWVEEHKEIVEKEWLAGLQ